MTVSAGGTGAGRREDPRIAAVIRADLDSGEWRRRWWDLLALDELDLGYRVVVARR
jgi:hypothetical protein